jgi:hypothetical protein
MRRAPGLGGCLAAVAVFVGLFVLAADENPPEAFIGLRNFLRDCDWKGIFS